MYCRLGFYKPVSGQSNHLTIVDPKFYVEDFDVFYTSEWKKNPMVRGEELPEAESYSKNPSLKAAFSMLLMQKNLTSTRPKGCFSR